MPSLQHISDLSPRPATVPKTAQKWLKWEFWPAWLATIPVVSFWLWFSIRARHLFFFTAVNPGIETGGVFGESKMGILRKIPAPYLPKTLLLRRNTPWQEALKQVREAGIGFPMILKPDIGKRGFLVGKIDTEAAFRTHFESVPIDWIVQEYIHGPMEGSIFFHRDPKTDEVRITSFCMKEFLSVQGDGRSTIRDLMAANLRTRLQLDRFEREQPDLLQEVLPKGQVRILEPIGNHCRGTTFLSGNQWIDTQLIDTFGSIVRQIPGILYGRFDLRFRDPEDLKNGKHFKILELNGIAAEPAHVYDPGIPVFQKYVEIFRHWRIIFKLYRLQTSLGIRPDSWSSMKDHYIRYRRYLKGTQKTTKT